MEDTKTPGTKKPRGPGSFCISKAALNALLDSGATAYEVCAYLTLAKSTDESGRYSAASIRAVNTATGANKTKGGPVDKALERLKTIRAKSVKKVSNGKSGKSHAWVDQVTDLGPILFDRDGWLEATGELLPDYGPNAIKTIRYVLPDFEEPPEDRVWFGNNLVSGVGGFTQPLKALKNAGDVAARLLLALYAVNDMETWGGVRPVGAGHGPWVHYEPVDTDTRITGGARLHRAKDAGPIAIIEKRITEDKDQYWRALSALQSAGLVYEVVMVLNRNAIKAKFPSGAEYGDIPEDAEPFYELDCRSRHGYKPDGEEGVGWATAKTAGDFGKPVTLKGGKFDGTYAAIVPDGYGAMIAGIYRLRFRVANPKNAGVKGAWAGIHQRNREALELVNSIRSASGSEPLTSPKAQAEAAKDTPVSKKSERVFPGAW